MKKTILALTLLAAGVTVAVAASNPKQERRSLQAELKREMANFVRFESAALPTAASNRTGALTDAEVGDSLSFGRNVRFIGTVQSGVVSLQSDCTPDPAFPLGPDDHCVVTSPAPATTVFNYPDVGRVLIPGKSANSLFCHWQTPFATFQYYNPTGIYQGFARVNVTATYKIQNPVLNNPALINPNTGLPFGGSFNTGLAGVRDARGLQPGDNQLFRTNETRVCLGGLVSKRALVEAYGLTEAQATDFFTNDTIITIGLAGNTRLVDFASIIVGTRFVGD